MGEMKRINVWLSASCLACAFLVWNYAAGLEGTEFSGGRITGPILNLSDLGLLLFVVVTVLSFFYQRIAGFAAILASLFCLPLFIYFTAPGAFLAVFRGEYSVPAPSNFVWNRWGIAGIVALLTTMSVAFQSMAKRPEANSPEPKA
jgi:hypothetical protein